MSSILKALEKVEDAQNQKRNPGAGGLGRKRERRPAWLIPAWSLGGAAVATLVTYSIMGGFGKPAPPAAQVVATAPQPAARPAAPVAEAAVSTAPVATEKPVAAPVKSRQTRDEVKAPVRKQQVGSVPKLAAKPQRSLKVPEPPVSARPAAVHAAPALVAPPQEIRVTGIAWQNDSQSSFAMVNGRPVRQGAVVDGYKVEQIFEDSVRFTGGKGPVTIPLGAAEQ
uniref:General secretion pathway protein GspB n=1 Tax=Geobacter sp. (strain M21) TaxID=443144 RepID=C6E0J0_GEOSM